MKLVIFLILVANNIYSQIDSTDWYPLAVGNKWQYSYGIMEVELTTIEVIGDTTMPNGKTYSIITNYEDTWYERNYENKYAYIYRENTSSEEILYDFVSEDGTIINNSWGIKETLPPVLWFGEYNLSSKVYEIVNIDSSVTPPDTTWGIVDAPTLKITQGIGNTPSNGLSWLNGVIINGVQYGVITDMKKTSTSADFMLNQNYPNPFNPLTRIKYEIPYRSQIEIIVYDILGKEIKTLVNEVKNSGIYEVEFNAINLSSGVYYYTLRTEHGSISKKLLLLK